MFMFTLSWAIDYRIMKDHINRVNMSGLCNFNYLNIRKTFKVILYKKNNNNKNAFNSSTGSVP